MARRPFDPAAHGLSEKVDYQQGDVLDRASVDALVDGADVVVHLAFIIIGDPEEAQRINPEGSRNVFEATVGAGAKRLVYTSSVAAYGFHADNPQPLTEDVPPRGSEDFYYSAQKAELERVLDDAIAGTGTEAYVFRPCIVAGAGALDPDRDDGSRLLPIYGQLRLARRALDQIPFLGPVLPDPGVEFQLVHTLDVASALRAAVEGAGAPGRYNLAGPGSMSIARMARACGWWSVPVPGRRRRSAQRGRQPDPGAASRGRMAERLPGADDDGHPEGPRASSAGRRSGTPRRRCGRRSAAPARPASSERRRGRSALRLRPRLLAAAAPARPAQSPLRQVGSRLGEQRPGERRRGRAVDDDRDENADECGPDDHVGRRTGKLDGGAGGGRVVDRADSADAEPAEEEAFPGRGRSAIRPSRSPPRAA